MVYITQQFLNKKREMKFLYLICLFFTLSHCIEWTSNCTQVSYTEEDIICKTDVKSLCSIGLFAPSKITCKLDEEYGVWKCKSKEPWIADPYIDCNDPCIETCSAYYEPGNAIWTLTITFFGIMFFVCLFCITACAIHSTQCFFTTGNLSPVEKGIQIGGVEVKATRVHDKRKHK